MVSNMSTSSLGQAVLAVTTVFAVLAVVACFLRVWASTIRRRPWSWSDTTIIASMVCAIAQLCSLYFETLFGGLGFRTHQISPAQISTLYQAFTANNISWILATNLIKLSVLLFYLDLFSIRMTFRNFALGFIGFVVVYCISSLLCVFTICTPFDKTWNHVVDGHCGNIMNALLATAVINTVEDLIVVVMPIPILYTLQISQEKRLGMIAVLSIGLVISAINFVRMCLAAVDGQEDPVHSLAAQNLLMNLEVSVGICSACAPTIKPLFNRQKYANLSKPSYAIPLNSAGTIGSERSRHGSIEKRPISPDDERYDRMYGEKL